MEQNLVSDEELIEKINQFLNESNQDRKVQAVEVRQEDALSEKFYDVCKTTEPETTKCNPSDVQTFDSQKNLVLENHYLSLQLQAEKKKSKELQSKFKLFENSVKYFEHLNGQLETIKRAVDEDSLDADKEELETTYNSEAMQKIRPKNIHTAASGIMSTAPQEDTNGAANFSEPQTDESGNKQKFTDDKEEVSFRDAEDFKQLEEGLEIVKDKNSDADFEAEKVFITKTEKRCLEDIGNLAARTRVPADDKHQKFFERDRRRFANSIVMPEIQEVDKSEVVPPEIISKTKETPVNITSTELDGLRSYLLQLKELIARRETAWARTTERDYNQRVEITRFKNEVSHLRTLCEKRQRDVKERDQIIAAKDEEIRDLQKRIQGLRNAIIKLEKKDERLMDTLEGMTNEVMENSHIVQRSYNAMKRQSIINRSNMASNVNITTSKQPANLFKPSTTNKDAIAKKPKTVDKLNSKKVKPSESTSNDEDGRSFGDVTKQKILGKDKPRTRHRSESVVRRAKDGYERVDEKLQRVEEMLHNEVLKGNRKMIQHGRPGRIQTDLKSLLKNHVPDQTQSAFIPANIRKLTPSNSTIRQEMLAAMTGLNPNPNLGLRTAPFSESKRNSGTATVIANALLAARNSNLLNY